MRKVVSVLIVGFLALAMIFLAQVTRGVMRVGDLIAERDARGERIAAHLDPDSRNTGGQR